jgi:hypothetical protein
VKSATLLLPNHGLKGKKNEIKKHIFHSDLRQYCEDWSIAVICDNVKCLALEFNFCSFCWVNREANMVAHTLAKVVPPILSPVLYFLKNLPALLEEAWFRDFRCSVSST